MFLTGFGELKKYTNLINKAKRSGLNETIKSGGGLHIRPTIEQRGEFLGSLLAGLGVPLVVNVVKGLFNSKRIAR